MSRRGLASCHPPLMEAEGESRDGHDTDRRGRGTCCSLSLALERSGLLFWRSGRFCHLVARRGQVAATGGARWSNGGIVCGTGADGRRPCR
jgi:hypothetical protein